MSDHEQEPPNGPNDHDTEDIIELCDDPAVARRAQLAVARHFDGDAAKIHAAMLEYQGTYPSMEKYVTLEIEEHIAPYMQWMLEGFIDLAKIAQHWIKAGRNWILLDTARGSDKPRGVHVFLSSPPPFTEEG